MNKILVWIHSAVWGVPALVLILGVGIFLLSGGKLAQVPTIAGIGTIITALFMGPLITFFKRTLSDPLLKGAES